ncbi:conjugal transfer protein TraF [Vibrio sp. MA40-2]|uniref:conjugal transfer protein TraF n=1 Tax=Vibrio sp. MA40-2 TaxID=3391828 RepID=UPI0039A59D17
MKKIAVVVSATLGGLAFNASAGTNLADARSVAMGGTGVASADYLTSSFHNPALGALYRLDGHSRGGDDFGLLLPGFGVQLNDQDDMVTTVDDSVDTYDKYEDGFDNGTASAAQSSELDELLEDLEDKAPVNLNAGVGVVIAVPTQYISVNLFAAGYADVVAISEIADTDSSYDSTDATDVKERFEDSEVGVAGVVVTEIGVALSKQFEIYGQNFAFGISPKLQQFETYASFSTLRDFEIDDYDENKQTDSAFNVDLGAAWIHNNWRVGMVVKDAISKDVQTIDDDVTYQMEPKITIGGAYSSNFFTASLDVDLTKETRFTNLEDDTQFVRFGLEGDAWGWAQLRAGYSIDLEDNTDNTITAGLGLSPFDVINLDLAATYANESSFGASANLAFTF